MDEVPEQVSLAQGSMEIDSAGRLELDDTVADQDAGPGGEMVDGLSRLEILMAGESDEDDDAEINDLSETGGAEELTSAMDSVFTIDELKALETLRDMDHPMRADLSELIWRTQVRLSERAWNARPVTLQREGSASRYKVEGAMAEMIRLAPQRLPCCINGCAAFDASHDQEINCPHCNEPVFIRLSDASVKPRQTFLYIPIGPRLQLDFACHSSSQEMRDYREATLEDVDDGDLSDFWSGQHYKKLHRQGLFNDPRDVALSFSTDGVNVTRQRTQTVWPGVITNHNLPPETRYRSLMLTVLIPGPREPKDLTSFLKPIVAELMSLSSLGLEAWDASRNEVFRLKAHLCLVTGDCPAIAKMMAFKGVNGKAPCRKCEIQGIQGLTNHQYYPWNMRSFVDRPDQASNQTLVLRSNLKETILNVLAANSADLQRQYGIAGLSPVFDIATLEFPDSFGSDIMHLFSNVAILIWKVWTGGHASCQGGRILGTEQVMQIGLEMAAATKTVPVSIARRPRDINKHVGSFKATEWSEFITIWSAPLLRHRLPIKAFKSWLYFVQGVRLAVKVSLTQDDVTQLQMLFENSVMTTEKLFYDGDRNRVSVCTSQLHALLHVAENIRQLGPSFVSWQYGLERYVGQMEQRTTSKSQQGASLQNSMLMLERSRYLSRIYNILSPDDNAETANIGDVIENDLLIGRLLGRPQLLNRTEVTNLSSRFDLQIDVSADVEQWQKARRDVTVGTANTFVICADRGTASRDRCLVEFFGSVSPADGEDEPAYIGKVVSFVRIRVAVRRTATLARIRVLATRDRCTVPGLCTSIEHQGQEVMVPFAHIVGPVGRLIVSTGQNRLTYAVCGYRVEYCA